MAKKYVFKPYSPSYPSLFQKEKERLMKGLGNRNILLEHVGSTAVPHLGGKGIIDIAMGVERDALPFYRSEIEKLGYEYRENGSSIDRWFFRIDLPDKEEGTRRYHLHLTFSESQEWKDLLFFRNYLRTHEKERNEYATLKENAAAEVAEEGERYRKLKDPFFQKILEKTST